jgi:amidase
MALMDQLTYRPAAELATLVRDGEVSASELVSASLERIESLDPLLNAFVEVDGERALSEAEKVRPGDDRAFAGVPIAVKANVPVQGMCMNFGSRFLAGHRAGHSAYLVHRLREAGFVIVGTTNLPEFGILPTTEPRHSGATRNPWDTSRTPGGSSGGSAVAVAAGLVPVAHANDGGGSIRIPAACCGLVGLKPSRGRVSRGPDLGDSFLSSEGVLTRTVAETAQMLDVLAGYEVGDATWAPRPSEPYATVVRRDPGRLRVALTTSNAMGVEPDPESQRGLHATGELLASLGHEVVETAPALPDGGALELFRKVFGAAVSLQVTYGELLAGRPPEDDEIEPLSREIAAGAQETSSVAYVAALAQLQALARGVIAFFAEYDLLLTPSLAQRPLPIGELHGAGADPPADFVRAARFVPYAPLFNITGQPAISVPAGFGDDGLPVGIHLAAKPLGEDTLLQVAAQLEAARPWAERRPSPAAAAGS